jgi:hypothetical protein
MHSTCAAPPLGTSPRRATTCTDPPGPRGTAGAGRSPPCDTPRTRCRTATRPPCGPRAPRATTARLCCAAAPPAARVVTLGCQIGCMAVINWCFDCKNVKRHQLDSSVYTVFRGSTKKKNVKSANPTCGATHRRPSGSLLRLMRMCCMSRPSTPNRSWWPCASVSFAGCSGAS